MPRLKVPSLKDLIGAPMAKPQAKESSLGYIAPRANRGSTDLEQFGNALTNLGSASGEILSAANKQQSKEDFLRGTSAAIKHFGSLRGDLTTALAQAEKNGWLPNGARPDVKQGYLTQLGALWATSPQVENILANAGGVDVNQFIDKMVQDHGSIQDFERKLDQYVSGGIGEAVKSLPTNFYSRDVGFMQSINAVTTRKKAEWMRRYTNAVSTKALEVNAERFDRLMNTGDYKGAIEWWITGVVPRTMMFKEGVSIQEQREAEDARGKAIREVHAYTGPAPRLTLPAGVKPKEALFRMISSHIMNDVVGDPISPSYARNLGIAKERLATIRGIVVSNLKTRLDAGEMESKYQQLDVNLSGSLIDAQNRQRAVNSALRKGTEEKLADIFAANVDDTIIGAAYKTLKPDGGTTPLTAMTSAGEIGDFIKALKANKVVNPINGEAITYNEYFTAAERSMLDDTLAISMWNASADTLRTRGGKVIAEKKTGLEEKYIKDPIQELITDIAGGAAGVLGTDLWSDEDILAKVNTALKDIQNNAKLHGLSFDIMATHSDLRAYMDKNFPETYRKKAQAQQVQAIVDNLIQNPLQLETLIGMPALQRMGRINRMNLSPTDKTAITNLITKGAKSYNSHVSIDGTMYGKNLEALGGNLKVALPAFSQWFNEAVSTLPKARMEGRMFADPVGNAFENVTREFMTRHYVPVIKKLAQDNFYDLESVAPEVMNQIIGDGVTMHGPVPLNTPVGVAAVAALGGSTDSLTVQFKKWPIAQLQRVKNQKPPGLFAETAKEALKEVKNLATPTDAEYSELWKAYMKILTIAAPK